MSETHQGEMPKFRWTVEIEVAAIWVADGFDLTKCVESSDGGPEALIEIGEAAKWFRQEEATIRVVEAPDAKEIRKEQGYKK